MYKTSYIYIRLAPRLKAQIKAEAALKGQSLNEYVESILRKRNHAKKPIGMQEVLASGR